METGRIQNKISGIIQCTCFGHANDTVNDREGLNDLVGNKPNEKALTEHQACSYLSGSRIGSYLMPEKNPNLSILAQMQNAETL